MKNNPKSKCMKTMIASLAIVLGGGCIATTALNNNAVYAQGTKASESNILIDDATVWNYLDNNTDPASGLESMQGWTETNFNDTAWNKAAGTFGAKKGVLTSFDGFTPTVLLNQYYETGKNTPAFFFRTAVNVENVKEITSLTAMLYHDDEAAVYINGNKVFSDLSKSDSNTNLYYSGHGGGAPEKSEIRLNAEECGKYLKEGKNVIAVEIHNDRETSSDIYFEFKELTLNRNETTEIIQKSTLLSIGSDETSRNLTWYANTDKAGQVQYGKTVNGAFPETYTTVEAQNAQSNDAGFYTNQATLSGLEADTQYAYRVINEDKTSDVYTFTTGNSDRFNFILAGDPQIGAGNTVSDTEGWNQTLKQAVNLLKPDFMVSAGDQVNTANNESQYAGYANETLTSLASASTIGNHDSGSLAYSQHFNLPNVSETLGATAAGKDYWFVYNNTLFMDINSNNRSTAEHKAFLEEAIKANPDVRWKTVVFHHSVYSTASHFDDSDIIARREELPQLFNELDIDVVLMGHDHVYTRTYMMNDGFTPDRSNGVQSSVTDPEGILYLTANSASGSKYYDIAAPDAEFSAVMDQSKRRTITNIEVSDTAYTMTTYYADDMSVLDSFTINKSKEVNKDALAEMIVKAETAKKKDYTENSWNVFEKALEDAKTVLAAEAASQLEVDEAYNTLKDAYNALKQVESDFELEDKKDGVSTNDISNKAALGTMLMSAAGVLFIIKKEKHRKC